MSVRTLHFERADASERQHFEIGPPVGCAAESKPFFLVEGEAEIFLRTSEGQRFLTLVEPGDPLFPALPEGTSLVMLVREKLAAAPLLAADRPEAERKWREKMASALVAIAGEDNDLHKETGETIRDFNVAFAETLRDYASRRTEAEIARLRDLTQLDEEPASGVTSLSELLSLCAQDLGIAPPDTLPADAGFDFEDAPSLARRFGLSARAMSLNAGWYRNEQGPLLLQDFETGAATCALWHRGAYRLPDGTAIAAPNGNDFDYRAYSLSAPLPAEIDGFKSLARYVIANNRSELKTIALAATIVAILGAITPLATGWILSDLAPAGEAALLFGVGGGLFLAALLTYLLETVRGMAMSRIQGKSSARLATALFDRILRLPTSFFRDFTAGDLNQRIAGIDEIRELILSVLLTAGLSAVLSIFYFAVLAWYDLTLAIVSAALISVYVLIVVMTRILQIPLLRRAYALDGKLAEQSYEMIGAVAKLRTAAAERRALSRWASLYGEERDLERKAGAIAGYSAAITDSWQVITQVVLFAVVATLAGSALAPGSFIAFLVAFGAFQAAFVTLSEELIELYAAQPQIDRALPILRATPELSLNRTDPGVLTGAITVRDVHFTYSEGQSPVLSGVSVDIPVGAHVAIVGGSGSGKSTLLRLLLGFETPDSGHIYYGNHDIADVDASLLRRQIGVVLQSSSLFAGSIIENIRGAHDASLEQCMEAAENAGLARDLDYFPMGIHTPITEGAAVLSGGQRQRILIARALVARPKILFFDEATSALDNQSQALVADTLDSLTATRITIAHRLSTIEEADTICVLRNGQIAEQGSYQELMAAKGAFAALASRQLMEE